MTSPDGRRVLTPLDVTELARLHNEPLRDAGRIGFANSLQRLLEGATVAEKHAARRWCFDRAGRLLSGDLSSYAMAERLRVRMVELQRAARGWIDLDTVDGCLSAALLLRNEVPAGFTIQRVLDGDRRPTHREAVAL